MKNIIDKKIIEGKLAELEQELLILEEAFKGKLSINSVELQLQEDAHQIDQDLTEIINIMEKETPTKSERYKSKTSLIPLIATNL